MSKFKVFFIGELVILLVLFVIIGQRLSPLKTYRFFSPTGDLEDGYTNEGGINQSKGGFWGHALSLLQNDTANQIVFEEGPALPKSGIWGHSSFYRSNLGLCLAGGKWGDGTTNTLTCLQSGQWRDMYKPSTSAERYNHGGGHIILADGEEAFCLLGGIKISDGSITNSVICYRYNAGIWSSLANPMAVARHSLAVTGGSSFFTHGGNEASGLYGLSQSYVPGSQIGWQTPAGPDLFRTNHAAVRRSDGVWMFGGTTGTASSTRTNSVVRWTGSAWENKTSLTQPTSGQTCWETSGTVYCFGGWIGTGTSRSNQLFALEGSSWAQKGSFGSARAEHAVATDGINCAAITGGQVSGGSSNEYTIIRYNGGTCPWENTIPPTPTRTRTPTPRPPTATPKVPLTNTPVPIYTPAYTPAYTPVPTVPTGSGYRIFLPYLRK